MPLTEEEDEDEMDDDEDVFGLISALSLTTQNPQVLSINLMKTRFVYDMQ